MKVPEIIKSAVEKQHEITVIEAGNMWNKLLARYDLIESMLFLRNYIKDQELQKETQIILNKINRQIQQLEKTMAKYSVSLMARPAAEMKISEDAASITDRYIFSRIYHSIKRFLPVHIISFEQSTSPGLREMFKSFLLEEMDMYDQLRYFGLKKNWIQSYPEYQSGEKGEKERPSIMEVAQMWIKLIARYETIEFTNYMANYAEDLDFKTVISLGQDLLKGQILELENMMQKYSVALPGRPPEADSTTQPHDTITDRYVFRQIFRGIQSFLPLHMVAFQESNTPFVWKKFKSLLIKEIDIYEHFISYGLLKGWVYKPPTFKR